MKQYCLKITSKSEKSLNNFLYFFSKHLSSKFSLIQKSVLTHNDRKIITLLKSPHVNKTAQEHFEVRLFTKKVQIQGVSLRKNLIFLKKILDKLFQDVHIQLEFKTNKNIHKLNESWLLSPDNFRLQSSRRVKANLIRDKRKTKSKELQLKHDSLVSLTKFLCTISTFGEVIVRSSGKL